MILLVPLLWILPLCFTIGLLYWGRPHAAGRLRLFAMGVGWQALWSLPVLIVQAARAGHDFLAFLYMPWLVHCGGKSVTSIFESTVGDRRDTLAGNVDYFMALTAVQMTLLALVFAWSYRSHPSLKDRRLLLIGAFVLTNGFLNINWPWYGT